MARTVRKPATKRTVNANGAGKAAVVQAEIEKRLHEKLLVLQQERDFIIDDANKRIVYLTGAIEQITYILDPSKEPAPPPPPQIPPPQNAENLEEVDKAPDSAVESPPGQNF